MSMRSPQLLLLIFLWVLMPNGVLSSDPLSLSHLPGIKSNFTQCVSDVRNHTLAYEPFLVRLDGQQTTNSSEAVGADYGTCKAYCGTAASPFQWSLFSQQFTGWLLPFLALTAQLPYESDGTWHDLMSLFLTVGSPPLAMYSLALTIFNSRYARRQLDGLFLRYQDPQRQLILDDLKLRVFQSLRVSQQEPFELGNLGPYDLRWDNTEKAELELRWWKTLHETLSSKARSFTASLATQAAWAFVAFSFTWVDALGSEKIGTNVTAYGLAISLCWSWVMVLVLGWFFAGVSLSRRPMTEAITRTNLTHPDTLPRLAPYERRRGRAYVALSRRIAGDAERPGPLYNYARAFVWAHMVEQAIETIRLNALEPQPTVFQIQSPSQVAGPSSTTLMMTQIVTPPSSPAVPLSQPSRPPLQPIVSLGGVTMTTDNNFARRYLWEEGEALVLSRRAVYSRMAWAAISALVLNIATVSSAFWLDFLTPSVGLGCRSGGVLVYWMGSYIVWIAMVSSAALSDRWSVHEAKRRITKNGRQPGLYPLGVLAVALRTFGKAASIINSAWIILHSLFEFSRFYSQCYCQTNRGTAIWLFLDTVTIREVYNVRETWFGLAILTGAVCTIYIAFMGLWTTRRF
ncbi:hypothetical protein FRC17_010212 [Serendipita sp. 399]|nr:hypothetical protein FRC17_010212 [Serendipita sp. 399]